MSIIGQIAKDVTKLLPLLEKYEKMVNEAEPHFKIDGQRIGDIVRVLPGNLARYAEAAGQLKVLEEFLIAKQEEVESRLWKRFNEKYPRQLSTKDIQAYIAGEPEFIQAKELVLEVKYVRSQMESIVEGFQQMGWMLKHATDLTVNDMRDAIL